MKLTVIILVIVLLAYPVGTAIAAAESGAGSIMNDLDALKYRTDDLSNRVESELTDLNIVESSLSNSDRSLSNSDRSLNNTSVTTGVNTTQLAQRGAIHADGYERLLTDVEKSFWAIESHYDPGKFSNKDDTAIESRMSAIQGEIDRTRSMLNDMRITADRIERRT